MDDNSNLPEQNQDSGSDAQFIINDANIKRVAALAVSGMSQNKIALTLKISRRQVRNVFEDDRFKALVEDIGNDSLRVAQTYLRQQIAGQAKEVERALKEQLKNNNLEAVKIALKLMGLDKPDEGPQDNGGLTVILANAKDTSKTIEVKPNKSEDFN